MDKPFFLPDCLPGTSSLFDSYYIVLLLHLVLLFSFNYSLFLLPMNSKFYSYWIILDARSKEL